MPLFHHSRNGSTSRHAEPATAAPPVCSSPSAPVPARPAPKMRPVPVTRTSVAWVGVWTAVVVLVAFIVFILQNTRDAQVSFFWLHGTLPLAVGLLIAMAAGMTVTLMIGTARISQLHRLARRHRD